MSLARRKGRLVWRWRRQVPVLAALAADIERKLDSQDLDIAIPTLEPSLEEARTAAGRLKAHLSDLAMIVELEHGDDRR